jgi:hypothetical protein
VWVWTEKQSPVRSYLTVPLCLALPGSRRDRIARSEEERRQASSSLAIASGAGRSSRSSSGTAETILYVATPIGFEDSFSA